METLNKFYLNDPYFLLLAQNAQPYPVTPQTAPIATNAHQNKLWQWIALLVALGLISVGAKKLLAYMAEKDSSEK